MTKRSGLLNSMLAGTENRFSKPENTQRAVKPVVRYITAVLSLSPAQPAFGSGRIAPGTMLAVHHSYYLSRHRYPLAGPKACIRAKLRARKSKFFNAFISCRFISISLQSLCLLFKVICFSDFSIRPKRSFLSDECASICLRSHFRNYRTLQPR